MNGYRPIDHTESYSEPDAVTEGTRLLEEVTRMNNKGGSSKGAKAKIDSAIYALSKCDYPGTKELIQGLNREKNKIGG